MVSSNKILEGFDESTSLDEFKAFLKHNLTVEFVGPNEAIDKMNRKAHLMTHLKVRPHVVFQWLSVLKRCHKFHANDLEVQPFDNFAISMEHFQECVMNKIIEVTDNMTVNVDTFVGDDMAQVRS